MVGSLRDSYGYPSTEDECAQTDIASSISFGEALVQKKHMRCQSGTDPVRTECLRDDSATQQSVLRALPASQTIDYCSKQFTCRAQNADTPRASRVGAHGGAAGRGRAGQDADRTVRPGDNRPSYPQGVEDTCSERLSRSTNKRNLM